MGGSAGNEDGVLGVTDAGALTRKLPEATFDRMRMVGLKVLKNRLAEYVRLAAAGEVVLISDRDRVVAELVPPAPHRAAAVPDAVLAAAVREGLVTPAALPPGPPPEPPRVAPLRTVLAELAEDRADR